MGYNSILEIRELIAHTKYEEAKDYLVWKLGDYIKDLKEQPWEK